MLAYARAITVYDYRVFADTLECVEQLLVPRFFIVVSFQTTIKQ